MKALITILYIFFFCGLFAQIPNGSFENWETDLTDENPSHWTTNNVGPNFISVTKVMSLTDGLFAMKIKSRGPSFEGLGPGKVYCYLLPTNVYNTLSMTYRIDSLDTECNIEMIISQLNGQEEEQIGYWKRESVSNQDETLEIQLSKNVSDTLKIEIRANSRATPIGYSGHAEVVVDEMSLSYLSATNTEKKSEIMLFFPNPSTGSIFFKNLRHNSVFELYNIDGKLLKSGEITNELIHIQDEGAYILKYGTLDDWKVNKLIVRK